MPSSEFSYWGGTDRDRETVRSLIQSGHIDCIHSFGDLASTRGQAAETLEHLEKHDCKLRVWIDHAVAPSNFGADIMGGFGDVPGHDVYHADLTLDFGIEFIWVGRVTSIQGQDVPPSLTGIGSGGGHSYQFKTVAKEAAKIVLGRTGNEKYRMHATNDLLRGTRLRDGQTSIEFLRSNPHPGGISCGDNSAGLGTAINSSYLDRLEKRNARAVVYTHMGKKIDPDSGFCADSRRALEELAQRFHDGNILVTTTYRLLNFARLIGDVKLNVRERDECIEISVGGVASDVALDGLSIDVPVSREYELVRDGKQLPFRTIPCEHDKTKKVLVIDWHRLDYPDF